MPARNPIDDIFDLGYAVIPLKASDAEIVSRVRVESGRFFTLADDEKRLYGSDDFNFGFRPYGRQYSMTPQRMDMNESFAYWADNPMLVPHAEMIGPFLDALRAYWTIVADRAEELLTQVALRYSYTDKMAFREASYLEINWYLRESVRDLLQDRHEDGHLLTFAIPDGPGLEIEVDGRMTPLVGDENELIVWPGSLLTAMTGGEVSPLYHQVRNHHLERRITLLFLLNPSFDRPVRPYVGDGDPGVDVASMARNAGAMFGLPQAPIIRRDPAC